jgi:hypothetical protein
VPHKVKPGTRIQSYITDKLHDTSPQTVSCRSDVRASEEVGSPSAPCAAMSGSNRIALKASCRSNRSRQLSVESGNYTQRRGYGRSDIVVLGGLEHRNARAPSARSYNKPNAKRPSSGACGPIEDIEPARNDPRLPEGSFLACYDRLDQWRSDLIGLWPRDHDSSSASKRLGVRSASSNNSATNRCSGAQRAPSYDNQIRNGLRHIRQ